MKLLIGLILFTSSIVIASPVSTRNLFPDIARSSHTSTKLPNGDLLFVGGTSRESDFLDSVETYNHSTGHWTRMNPLKEPRMLHQSVLLQDGTVFVMGGRSTKNSSIGSTELYDSVSGNWTLKAPMLVTRNDGIFSANVLNDDRVLVIGGRDSVTNKILSNVEIYDPSINTWSTVAPLTYPRSGHTSTVLPNGKVLVTGGEELSGSLAEIYDPATNEWTLTASMTFGRYFHTATLLQNGNVLVAGGASSPTTVLDSAELYNPTTGTWSLAGTLNMGRGLHTATLNTSGNVLIVGGTGITFKNLDSAEYYNPTLNLWTSVGKLHSIRGDHTANLLDNGKIFIHGGLDYSFFGRPLATFEILDFASDTWSSPKYPAVKRSGHTATTLNDGSVLLVGGVVDGGFYGSVTNATEVYDPIANLIFLIDSMKTPRFGHSSILLNDGRVLVAGGADPFKNRQSAINSVEIYNPLKRNWTTVAPMNVARREFSMFLLPDGQVLVLGGSKTATYYSEPLDSVEIYNPVTNVWTLKPPMIHPRISHTATQLPNGKIIVIGGYYPYHPCPSPIEIYDPALDSWSLSPQKICMNSHQAVLMPDGKILLIDGWNDDAQKVTSFDPSNDNITQLENLPRTMYDYTAILSVDSKVILVGGDGDKRWIGETSIYDYQTNTWSSAPALHDRRSRATVTLLNNGSLYIHGGWKDEFGMLPFFEIIRP